MASLVELSRFSQILHSFRAKLPFHEELPQQVTEEEMEAMFRRVQDDLQPLKQAASNQLQAGTTKPRVNPYPSQASRMASSFSFREMAVFCRMLTLPVTRLETVRPLWEALSTSLLSKTYYLQLRAQLQFAPTHPVLLAEFTRCATFIRNTPGAMARVERLLKSTHDDLVRLQSDEDPVSHVLQEFQTHRTLLGIYAADQGLMRHAPLFKSFRESWFIQCGPEAYPLDGHELLQALELATPDGLLAMLARFLQVHTMDTFPIALTHQLIAQYGKPDTDSLWEQTQASGRDTAEGLSALRFWYLRERMKHHFGEKSLKYEVLLRFLHAIEWITEDPEKEAMQIHFKGFVVIDFLSVEPFSWICDPTELSLRYEEMVKTMREQGGQLTKRRRNSILDAKDFVIEQEGGAVVRLTFMEVGRLYTIDALSIRLGLQAHEIWGVM